MASDDKLTRLAGLLYLGFMPAVGLWYGTGRSLAVGDAATTLAQLQSNPLLFQFSIVAGVAGLIDYLVLSLLLYRLFSPLRQMAASLLLAFVAVSVPVSLAAVAHEMDVLSLLRLPSPDPAQIMEALNSFYNLVLVSSIFWSLWLLPLGWLMFQQGSRITTVLGTLLMLGSFFYLFAFIGPVFDPGYETSLLSVIAGIVFGIPSVLGEFGTAAWLLSPQPLTKSH
jgi:hypothetical protein